MFALPFGNLAFLNPWILAGLLALPLLWFLLRVFPPVPRMVHLPGAWLLEGLVPDQRTSSRTPWWLLLLRILIAALILLALAHPVINPVASLNIRGALRLVIDNDWAAAQTWNLQMQGASQVLASAGRDRTEIYLLTTAPEPGQNEIVQQGPMTAAQAQTILHGLKPHPWPARYDLAIKAVRSASLRDGAETLWLAHGLDNGHGRDLAEILQNQGGLTYKEPDGSQRPLLLLPRHQAGQGLSAAVQASSGFPDKMPVGVEALFRRWAHP